MNNRESLLSSDLSSSEGCVQEMDGNLAPIMMRVGSARPVVLTTPPVHCRTSNAPVYRRPIAPHPDSSLYNTGPLPKNYTPLFSFITVIAMVAMGAYHWRIELQSMLTSSGGKQEQIVRSGQGKAPTQSSAPDRKKSSFIFDVTDAFLPPTAQEKILAGGDLNKR